MRRLGLIFVAFAISAPRVSLAQPYQPLHAVKPLDGYVCMSLNLSQEQMMNPSVHVPIRSAPSAEAPVTGMAAAIVITKWPEEQERGYLRVLQLDGRLGWIDARYLKPWVNLGNTGDRCFPSLMSNGRIGFAFHH